MAVRAALVMAYLGLNPTSSISSGNQYTSIGIIVMLWLVLCLLVSEYNHCTPQCCDCDC